MNMVQVRRKTKPRPQLVMWYLQNQPPAVPAIDGCRVRVYEPGDEQGWLALLQANAELGDWDLQRVQKVLGETHVQTFVECGGRIVGCSGINDKMRDGIACWEIGWVAVEPAFQGRGIGKMITGTAVARALELQRRPIYLLTDDFRVPALCSYLKLGFTPDESDASYAGRWREIFNRLGRDYEEYNTHQATGDCRR